MTDVLRTEYRNRPLREVLNLSPRALLGVDANAEAALLKLEIQTVFDLATSDVFDRASKLVSSATDAASALFQHGAASSDMVKAAEAAGKKLSDLQYLPIEVLEGIPSPDAASIAAALDVGSVRELALYPPYRAAQHILNTTYFPENAPGQDPETPADLRPRTGEFPTERVQYSTLLLDEIPLGREEKLIDVQGADFQPINVDRLAVADAGFKQVAFGALLTFNQSWFAQGVTLGQLLHSVSLAPGESTRIAVIDWSRKSRAGQTEVIDETEDLTNDTSRNRSISEVTQAVANEAQGGFSSTNTNSSSEQSGTSVAGELSGGLVGSLLGGPSVSMGNTSSKASSQSHADSYSTSWGHRDIGASMLQNVNDRTHQHAHSSRSRRASVVKEVSQTEHENVSTRVLVNYNHMHALTIQYYEVVQVYRVEVALVKADRVIFIPIALVDFSDDVTVRRFREALARQALTNEIRDALRNLDVIEIAPDRKVHFVGLGNSVFNFARDAVLTRTMSAAATVASAQSNGHAAEAAPAAAVMSATVPLASVQPSVIFSTASHINEQLWTSDQVSRLSGLLGRIALRPDSTSLFLPSDVTIEGALVTGGSGLGAVFHTRQGGTVTSVSGSAPLALADVQQIGVTGSSADSDLSATLTLTVNRNGVRFPVDLPTVSIPKATTGETVVARVTPGGVSADLKQHLKDNQSYYSQVVYRSLDSTQIALLLSGYAVHFGNQFVPVSQLIEPMPIRYVGNYLAFKMNSDPGHDPSWAKWLDEHGIKMGQTQEDVVPLASGGTFAEAVLGRFNCAEKLDITRFWNWQDSPIPIQPSDIAAIQTGSRATPEDVKPGQLSAPIVNIQQPAPLPDPTGMAGILAAIQNGNMFRDMSGLQATIGLAQAALQATAAGAATAGQQAGTNMQNELQAQTERMRIAADLAKSAISAFTGVPAVGGAGGGGGSGHSQDGAKINYFDKMRGSGGGSAPGGGSSTVSPGPGGSTSSSGGAPGAAPQAPAGNGSGGSNGWSSNPGILAATWGDSVPRAQLVENALERVSDAGTTTGGSDSGSPLASSAPVAPYQAAPSLTFTDSAKLQTALEKAIGALEVKRSLAPGTLAIPFSIAEITDPNGPYPYAGYRDDETDYIASEAKVAVMYSAYALRDMVRRFAAATSPKSAKELFDNLKAQMSPTIRSSVARIASASGLTDVHRLPKYDTVFKVTPNAGGGVDIDFSSTYDGNLERMIVPSSNSDAGACIHGLGYSYLNGALAAGGFFVDSAASPRGLWVAGDYSNGSNWPYVRIPAVNDVDTAQGGNTRQMVRLVALVGANRILTSADATEMAKRLADAAAGVAGMAWDQPWIDRPGILKAGCITHNKLGLGPLKNGNDVRSEVSILDSPLKSGRRYVVSWQNLIGLTKIGYADVATLIRDTIAEYEI